MRKLSIITCTYNSEKYLQDCIDSVKSQNLNKEDFEHIFVDANSTDKTKDIVEKYKKETGYNVYIYEQKPKGVYAAMNYGAEKAQGEYLMFLNSDDWLEPGVLEKYLNYVKKTGECDLYYGIQRIHKDGITCTNNSSRFSQKIFYISGMHWITGHNIIGHQTVLEKKDTFWKLGGFDETKKVASDYGMWLALIKEKCTFKYYPEIIVNFRRWDGSISTNNVKKGIEEVAFFRKKYLTRFQQVLCFVFESFAMLGIYRNKIIKHISKR